MGEIILVRHGETEWSRGEIFRGRADIDLNATGIRQASLLGIYLSTEKIGQIYSSPLKRAGRTAGEIARFQKIAVEYADSLIDFDCGEWEGLTLEQVREKFPEIYRDWLDTPEQVTLPGGESLEDIRRRAMPFLEGAVARCPEGRIALVSHRVVLKVITCALLGLSNAHFWNIRMDNSAVTRFSYEDGRYILTEHNNTSFLREMRTTKLSDF